MPFMDRFVVVGFFGMMAAFMGRFILAQNDIDILEVLKSMNAEDPFEPCLVEESASAKQFLPRQSLGYCFATTRAYNFCPHFLHMDIDGGNCSAGYLCCFVRHQNESTDSENTTRNDTAKKDVPSFQPFQPSPVAATPQIESCGIPGAGLSFGGVRVSTSSSTEDPVPVMLRTGNQIPNIERAQRGENKVVRNSRREGRILGGNNLTDTSSVCWIGAITVDKQYAGVGTLVAPQWVLTTASVISRYISRSPQARQPEIRIYFGQADLNHISSSTPSTPAYYRAASVVFHPEYQTVAPGFPIGDAALLRLENPVNATAQPNVCVACMATQQDVKDALSKRCIAAGYGTTNESTSEVDGLLHAVDLPVLSKLYCEKAYQIALRKPGFRLDFGNVCAGAENGKDTCTRDGGASL